LAYALVGGKVYVGEQDDISVSLTLGYITSINEDLKIKVQFQQNAGLRHRDDNIFQYIAEINHQLSPDWEVRLIAEKEKDLLVSVKINYFWGF
jgi:hypothetical protein